MRRIGLSLLILLVTASLLMPLAGCGLYSKTPELREVVRLTDTPGANDLPAKSTTPGADNSTASPQLIDTKQPAEEKTPVLDLQPGISVSSRKISQGEKIEVEGWGFPSEAKVQVGFGRVNSEFDLVHQTRANQDGEFRTEIEVPDFVKPKDSWVVAAAAENLRIKVFSDELQING